MADFKAAAIGSVAYVDECFGNSSLSAVPGRVLIGDGELVKTCRKKPMVRQFFLFNDMLVYGNVVVTNKKYDKQRIIPLEDIIIECIADDEELNNGWLLKTIQKSFALFASSSTERNWWVKNMALCIQELTTKGNKMAVTDFATEHAPVWVPDNDEDECMQCHRTKFNILMRRHHCRKCGILVCNGCSGQRLELEPSGTLARVCNGCYNELKSAECGAVVTTADNVGAWARTTRVRESLNKSASSESAAAFAYSRPWTATLYPDTVAHGDLVEEQEQATLIYFYM